MQVFDLELDLLFCVCLLCGYAGREYRDRSASAPQYVLDLQWSKHTHSCNGLNAFSTSSHCNIKTFLDFLVCSLAGQRYKVPTTLQTQTRVAQFAGCYTHTHSFDAMTCRKLGLAPKDYQHSTKLLPVNSQTICFSLTYGILQQTKRQRSFLQDGERNKRKMIVRAQRAGSEHHHSTQKLWSWCQGRQMTWSVSFSVRDNVSHHSFLKDSESSSGKDRTLISQRMRRHW